MTRVSGERTEVPQPRSCKNQTEETRLHGWDNAGGADFRPPLCWRNRWIRVPWAALDSGVLPKTKPNNISKCHKVPTKVLCQHEESRGARKPGCFL